MSHYEMEYQIGSLDLTIGFNFYSGEPGTQWSPPVPSEIEIEYVGLRSRGGRLVTIDNDVWEAIQWKIGADIYDACEEHVRNEMIDSEISRMLNENCRVLEDAR